MSSDYGKHCECEESTSKNEERERGTQPPKKCEKLNPQFEKHERYIERKREEHTVKLRRDRQTTTGLKHSSPANSARHREEAGAEGKVEGMGLGAGGEEGGGV